MIDEEVGPIDTTGIVKASKKALREQRDDRLTKSLRDNLARRKLQIRARDSLALINKADATSD
jgi:hypothetical protein